MWHAQTQNMHAVTFVFTFVYNLKMAVMISGYCENLHIYLNPLGIHRQERCIITYAQQLRNRFQACKLEMEQIFKLISNSDIYYPVLHTLKYYYSINCRMQYNMDVFNFVQLTHINSLHWSWQWRMVGFLHILPQRSSTGQLQNSKAKWKKMNVGIPFGTFPNLIKAFWQFILLSIGYLLPTVGIKPEEWSNDVFITSIFLLFLTFVSAKQVRLWY